VSLGIADQIDTLVQDQSIFGTDAFGAGETNSGGVAQALPIYTPVTVGGSKLVCGTASAGGINIIGNSRFLTFSLGATQSITIRADYNPGASFAPFTPPADPDIILFEGGILDTAESLATNTEALTRTLEAGDYVIEVYDYSHVDPNLTDAQRRGITCFNVSVM
jgi:hypothetical protein